MNSQSEDDRITFQDPNPSASVPNASLENITSEQNDLDSSNGTELVINQQTVYVIDGTGCINQVDMNPQNIQETSDGIFLISEENQNDELASLLKSFNLYDELYIFLKGKTNTKSFIFLFDTSNVNMFKILSGKHINIEGLKYIQKHHIDKLFEGFDNFNARIIFEHKLGIWQSANVSLNFDRYVKNYFTKISIASPF